MVYACIPYNHYFTSHVLCLHLSPFSAARNFHFGFHCKALPFHNSQCLYHGHFSVPSFSISTFPTFFPPRGKNEIYIAFSLIFCYTYPIRFDYLLVCSYEPLIFIIPGNRFHIIYRSKPRHTVCLIFFAVVWPFRPIIHRRRL